MANSRNGMFGLCFDFFFVETHKFGVVVFALENNGKIDREVKKLMIQCKVRVYTYLWKKKIYV